MGNTRFASVTRARTTCLAFVNLHSGFTNRSLFHFSQLFIPRYAFLTQRFRFQVTRGHRLSFFENPNPLRLIIRTNFLRATNVSAIVSFLHEREQINWFEPVWGDTAHSVRSTCFNCQCSNVVRWRNEGVRSGVGCNKVWSLLSVSTTTAPAKKISGFGLPPVAVTKINRKVSRLEHEQARLELWCS